MRKYDLTINDNLYEVIIKEVSSSDVRVEVNGEEHIVSINAIKSLGLPALEPNTDVATAKAPAGTYAAPTALIPPAGRIIAPMPGQIRAIFIREGDRVKTGQKLLIMEAMKLENKIAANQDGIIEKILVRDGDTVNQGQELVIIKKQ